MKNLRNLNLKELSVNDKINIDGGWWGPSMGGLRLGLTSWGQYHRMWDQPEWI